MAISLLLPTHSYADSTLQSPRGNPLSFQHYLQNPIDANKIGLVRSMAQDRAGNIWIGGEQGLVRFDGIEFNYFKHDDSINDSLANNYIQTLVSDQRGTLWIGSAFGIQIYEPELEQFSMIIPRKDGENQSKYQAMARLGADQLILTSKTDIELIDIETKRIRKLWSTDNPGAPLYQKDLRFAFGDRQSRLWIATERNEIFVFDRDGKLLKRWLHNIHNLPSLIDTHIIQDREGNIWASAKGAGLMRVSEDLNQITNFYAEGGQGALPSNDVTGIGEDGEGAFWVSIDHSGLAFYSPQTNQFRTISHSRYDHMSPASDQPQNLFIDILGGLWVVQYPIGIDYFGGTNINVARYYKNPTDVGSLSHNDISHIFQDSGSRIWVGTGSGLNLFDPSAKTFKRYLFDTDPQTVIAIAETDPKTLWAGTWGNGLYQLDLDGRPLKHLKEKEGFLGTNVWSLLGDKSGQLWIGTGTKGLAKYSQIDGVFKHYPHETANPNSISNNLVWSIIERDAKTLLLGTNFGLNLFDKDTEMFTRIGRDSPFFKSQDIRALINLKNGQIWVGTTGGGITILDEQLNPIGNLGTKSGLPNQTVHGLAVSSDGMVWASTFDGVAYINPTTQKVITISRAEGLTNNYFDRNAVLVDERGSVYLGSTDGLSVVTPQSLERTAPESVAIINKLTILNKEVTASTPNTPLKTSIVSTDQLTLTYRDSLIGIGFSSTNLRGGRDIRFQYQLEGIDRDWTVANNERSATYANLPAGTYTFKVQAGNQKQFWPNSEDRLTLTVLPPPWLSASAKTVYFLFFVALLIIAYIFGSLQQKRRRAELILKTKNDFLSIMSHEIRTPLTGVLGMLQIALKDTRLNARTREQIGLGSLNAQALLNITNDILNINKIERSGLIIENINFNLLLMLKTATAAFSEFSESKGLLLNVVIDVGVPEFIVADPNRIRQVLTNLVGNALKFTQQGSISIYVRKRYLPPHGQFALEFSVADTGLGMSPSALAKVFEKFEQANNTTARIYGGSGLGLSICKALVVAMKGNISAESREGSGSVFTFVVPVEEGVAASNEAIGELREQHGYILNIICAEDILTNQLIIRNFIEEMAHTITMVNNGIEVIEAIRERHYDLILMDGRMPKMDGTEATKPIRAGVWSGLVIEQKDIPIIALTANITQADRDGYVTAGVNSIVGKPIEKAELLNAIEEVIQRLLSCGVALPKNTEMRAAGNTN